ncbi:hypothetical protein AB0L82_28575 [Nocardia sp. NPDC052001]|uniref:hypothetical protein n=1 Tax=Nocardia sp. NPDC052001 TaxID=3154853 RepID=UPI003416B874
MTDRIDAVPEADFLEQQTEVIEPEAEVTPLPEDDLGWTADEADLVEQSISVPMDDDYDGPDTAEA